MEREPFHYRGERERERERGQRWLRLLRDGGIALVGVTALAGLARDLSATRGPVVAWIIVTLLGGAAGLFAWSLLEVRDPGRRSPTRRSSLGASGMLPTGDLDPRIAVPLVPFGLFPAAHRDVTEPRTARRRPDSRAQRAPRGLRMRTRRTSAACAATPARRPTARASRRPPHTSA